MCRRAMRALSVAVLVAIGSGVARAQCISFGRPEEVFAHASVVFLGTALEVQRTGENGSHIISDIARFRVDRYWKGTVAREMRVGLDRPIAAGDAYLVFAAGDPPTTTVLCKWTEPIRDAAARLAWLESHAKTLTGGVAGLTPTLDRVPTDPRAEADIARFIKGALEDVLEAGRLPDGSLLGTSTRIALRQEMPLAGRQAVPAMLPERPGYSFFLLSEAAARAEADRAGVPVHFIAVDLPRVSTDSGSLRMGVDVILPRQSKAKKLCCCSAFGQFGRQDGRWKWLLWTSRLCG